jgi:hypothetical protein
VGPARQALTHPRGHGPPAVTTGRGHLVSHCAPPSRLSHHRVGPRGWSFRLRVARAPRNRIRAGAACKRPPPNLRDYSAARLTTSPGLAPIKAASRHRDPFVPSATHSRSHLFPGTKIAAIGQLCCAADSAPSRTRGSSSGDWGSSCAGWHNSVWRRAGRIAHRSSIHTAEPPFPASWPLRDPILR